MRLRLTRIILLLALAVTSFETHAQTPASYPTKPVKLVTGFPPGASTDQIARAFANKLSSELGQPVVVENKTGASGIIATEAVANAAPDGYTLLHVTTEYVINQSLRKNLAYSPSSFKPVSAMAHVKMYLAASPSLGAKTLADVIKAAKSKPGSVRYASWGVGSTGHLGVEMLASYAGVKMLHVPYRGVGPAMTDLLAGVVDLCFVSPASGAQFFQTGKLIPIGISSKKRDTLFPEVPAIAETYPEYEVSLIHGIVVPAGTPDAIVERLHKAIYAAGTDPSLVNDLAKQGVVASPSKSVQEYDAFLKAEAKKWGDIVRAGNITAED